MDEFANQEGLVDVTSLSLLLSSSSLGIKFPVDFVWSGELGLSGEYDFSAFINTMSIFWHVSYTLLPYFV